jgi:GAF domain-containing protein
VTGETLGTLVVEVDEQRRNLRATELVNAVARQVSQQIENLRLLESAERYRAEAEGASRRVTLEGWKDYTDANAAKGLSYIYDLKEVRPLKAGDQLAEESAVTLPLKVRDETVGKLLVQGLGTDDSDALELANAVAERLSAHIENLRLSEQTLKRAQREQALRQVTSAVRGSTDPATILRAAVRELGTLLGRKTVVRLETAEGPASQPHRPTDLVEDSIANSGGETVPPVGSPNAVGGDE